MRFSPRSLLAWFAVVIAGGEPPGRGRAMALPQGELTESAPDDRPAERDAPR